MKLTAAYCELCDLGVVRAQGDLAQRWAEAHASNVTTVAFLGHQIAIFEVEVMKNTELGRVR